MDKKHRFGRLWLVALVCAVLLAVAPLTLVPLALAEDTVTITWVDADGNTLQKDAVAVGELPEYTGGKLLKASDSEAHYSFSGWKPEVTEATADATYTAVFKKSEHEWDAGKITDEATCSKVGTMTYTCTVCDHKRTEEVAMLAHTEVVDKAVDASCTETGLTEGKHCSVCNAVLVAQEVVPAKGHTEVVDAAVEATCTETGLTEGKHCSVCNAVLAAQEVVPAKGHDWGEPTYQWAEDSSTVTATRVCKNDAEHVETETANAEKNTTEPTYESEGRVTYTATFENKAFGTQTREETLAKLEPTEAPTAEPTEAPTEEPTEEPTAKPTEEPTAKPTEEPTAEPTEEPTAEPTEEPTAEPTEEPTAEPTEAPTA